MHFKCWSAFNTSSVHKGSLNTVGKSPFIDKKKKKKHKISFFKDCLFSHSSKHLEPPNICEICDRILFSSVSKYNRLNTVFEVKTFRMQRDKKRVALCRRSAKQVKNTSAFYTFHLNTNDILALVAFFFKLASFCCKRCCFPSRQNPIHFRTYASLLFVKASPVLGRFDSGGWQTGSVGGDGLSGETQAKKTDRS